MEGKVADLRRLNAQVLEGLGSWVDLLVNELPLNLIRTSDWPPDELVEVVGCRLQDKLRNVDMTTVLNDLAVHELGDFSSRVVLWPVQLESLRCGVVVIQHKFKSVGNIDNLQHKVNLYLYFSGYGLPT